jgi:broad specificity phosphatase PhoE
MMTVLLVRHAEHAFQNRILLGRADGVDISQKGREQLRSLSEMLGHEPIKTVHSSPRRRARDTAEAIALGHGLPVEIRPSLDELDYGAWTGLDFETLERIPQWQLWNHSRAGASPPQGESMQQLQDRVLAHLTGLRESHAGQTVVLVTHAEPIRAVLLHAAGLSLNDFTRIDVPPGSVTRLAFDSRAPAPVFLPKALLG